MLLYIIKEATGLNCVLNLLFKINQSLCKKDCKQGMISKLGQVNDALKKLSRILPRELCVSLDNTLQIHFHEKTFLKRKEKKYDTFSY